MPGIKGELEPVLKLEVERKSGNIENIHFSNVASIHTIDLQFIGGRIEMDMELLQTNTRNNNPITTPEEHVVSGHIGDCPYVIESSYCRELDYASDKG